MVTFDSRTFSLALTVLHNSCSGHQDNCRYLIMSNKSIPLTDLSLLVLSRALSSHQQQLLSKATSKEQDVTKCSSTSLCGPLLRLLASMISTLASVSVYEEDTVLVQQVTDTIRYVYDTMATNANVVTVIVFVMLKRKLSCVTLT